VPWGYRLKGSFDSRVIQILWRNGNWLGYSMAGTPCGAFRKKKCRSGSHEGGRRSYSAEHMNSKLPKPICVTPGTWLGADSPQCILHWRRQTACPDVARAEKKTRQLSNAEAKQKDHYGTEGDKTTTPWRDQSKGRNREVAMRRGCTIKTGIYAKGISERYHSAPPPGNQSHSCQRAQPR